MRLIDADELIRDIANHHYLLKDSIGSEDYGMFTSGLIQLINEQPDYILEKRMHKVSDIHYVFDFGEEESNEN